MTTEQRIQNLFDETDSQIRKSITRNAFEWWSTKDFSEKFLPTLEEDPYINGKIYKESVDSAFEGRNVGNFFFSYPSTQWIVEKMHENENKTELKQNLNKIRNEVKLFFQLIIGGINGNGGTALLFIKEGDIQESSTELTILKNRTEKIQQDELLSNFYLLMRHVFLRETQGEIEKQSKNIAEAVRLSVSGHTDKGAEQKKMYDDALVNKIPEDITKHTNIIFSKLDLFTIERVEAKPKPEPEPESEETQKLIKQLQSKLKKTEKNLTTSRRTTVSHQRQVDIFKVILTNLLNKEEQTLQQLKKDLKAQGLLTEIGKKYINKSYPKKSFLDDFY